MIVCLTCKSILVDRKKIKKSRIIFNGEYVCVDCFLRLKNSQVITKNNKKYDLQQYLDLLAIAKTIRESNNIPQPLKKIKEMLDSL